MISFWFPWVYPSKRMDCQLVKNRVSHYHSDATFASAQKKKGIIKAEIGFIA